MLIVSHSPRLVGNSPSIAFLLVLRLILGNVPQKEFTDEPVCVVPNKMLRCEMSVTGQCYDDIGWNIFSQPSWTTVGKLPPNIFWNL